MLDRDAQWWWLRVLEELVVLVSASFPAQYGAETHWKEIMGCSPFLSCGNLIGQAKHSNSKPRQKPEAIDISTARHRERQW